MKTTNNQRFDTAYATLREWVYQNELQRRVWAKEVWGYPSGKFFKFAKIATPILSAVSIMMLIVYIMIIDMNNFLLYNDLITFETTRTTLAICCIALIFLGNLLFYFRKVKFQGIVIAVVSLISALHLATQCKLDMPNDKFFVFSLVGAGVMVLLSVVSAYMPITIMREKREINRMTDNTYKKITADTTSLLSLEEYADMIDAYLENEKEKESEHRQKIKRKRAERG